MKREKIKNKLIFSVFPLSVALVFKINKLIALVYVKAT